jgi:hypothetical protein
MTDKLVEHAENPYGNFCAECEEPWPCEVTRLRAENEQLRGQVAGMRATLKDFANPDHWHQNDDGEWMWHGFYPPFERPVVDLLGSLDSAGAQG